MGWRESCAGIVSRLGKWGGGTGDDGPGEGRGLLGQSVRCWGEVAGGTRWSWWGKRCGGEWGEGRSRRRRLWESAARNVRSIDNHPSGEYLMVFAKCVRIGD